ncbi:unnamed protein product [Rangifer tarandus platyrhynchus]|uniref:Uncharacterized protein n=1 Tax=Rangifer tarandus platyrhynchus TaxID=3082113 RepID=A0ABN8XLM4_RANTA|nr:unnamed protein product [Rangifer tarandus platyrhynchus]
MTHTHRAVWWATARIHNCRPPAFAPAKGRQAMKKGLLHQLETTVVQYKSNEETKVMFSRYARRSTASRLGETSGHVKVASAAKTGNWARSTDKDKNKTLQHQKMLLCSPMWRREICCILSTSYHGRTLRRDPPALVSKQSESCLLREEVSRPRLWLLQQQEVFQVVRLLQEQNSLLHLQQQGLPSSGGQDEKQSRLIPQKSKYASHRCLVSLPSLLGKSAKTTPCGRAARLRRRVQIRDVYGVADFRDYVGEMLRDALVLSTSPTGSKHEHGTRLPSFRLAALMLKPVSKDSDCIFIHGPANPSRRVPTAPLKNSACGSSRFSLSSMHHCRSTAALRARDD